MWGDGVVVSGTPDKTNACSARWRTDAKSRGEYLVPMMNTNPRAQAPSRPADFTLAMHISPGDTYEWSKVLLARANFNGTLELLTSAWERALGYGRGEFTGKTLGQLMRSGKAGAAAAVVAILDEQNMGPVDLKVRCRGGEAKCFRLHRRLDAYAHKIFIVAEETPASRSSAHTDERLQRDASGLTECR
jgi:hypothetical protein